jgi:hypothetical protein
MFAAYFPVVTRPTAYSSGLSLQVIVACGARGGARLAKDAETRWRRTINAWPHRRHKGPREHAARAE